MKIIKGIAVSSGIAIGRAFIYINSIPSVQTRPIENSSEELERLESAFENLEQHLAEYKDNVSKKLGKDQAEIFEAHRMMLHDPAFRDEIQNIIRSDRICAEAAVKLVSDRLQATFDAMQDEFFRARANDIKDITSQIIRILCGLPLARLESLVEPVILIANDLYPSDTVQMDKNLILGLVTSQGSKTSHSAILARSLQIPAIVGVGTEILEIKKGEKLILDGTDGQVIITPDPQTEQVYFYRQQKIQIDRSKNSSTALEPAITRDGKRIQVLANIGSIAEAERVISSGGEGVGLLRTEFLFLDRVVSPSEEEQLDVYTSIAKKLDNYTLTIRTLDVGGDKPLPYLSLTNENNPFLGNRGIRLCLNLPELFRVQLRAILRASAEHQISIMFPMITTIEEIYRAKALLDEVKNDLIACKLPYGDPKIGIMIETPSSALMADLFATQVSFFSIGTNDLTQYTLAADRTNPVVQEIADPYNPAVLRLIFYTIQNAHKHNIPVAMCGELAGDTLATPSVNWDGFR